MYKKLPLELFTEKDNMQISKFLKDLDICKLSVSQAENAWEIYFYSNRPFNKEILTEAEYFLEKKLPKIEKIKLLPVASEACLCDQDKLKAIFTNLLADQAPILRSCLEKTQIEYLPEEEIIKIMTGSSWAYKYLKNKKVKSLLEERLNFLEEKNLDLIFELNEDLEDFCMIEKMEEFFPVVQVQESPKKERKARTSSSNKAVRKLVDLREEEKNVLIEGRIFDISKRELRNNKLLIVFLVNDSTSSYTCKMIRDKKEGEKIYKDLEKESYYRISGNVQYDQFSKEYILMARDYQLIDFASKKDLAQVKRVELHLHTNMSKTDAMTPVSDYIKRAADWGHKAIAITDHGVVQAFPDAYFAGQKYGVKIIYGVEAYAMKDDKTYHFIILVKNRQGLKNLYHLISQSQLKYYKRVPRIPFELLEEYREGLIYGSACEAGDLIRSIIDKKPEEELKEIASFYDFLEIQPLGNNEFMIRNGIVNSFKDIEDINKKVVQLGEELEIPIIATGDVHFLNPEDEIYRRIIQTGQGYQDADNQPPLYYRTTEEMLAEFDYLGQEKAHEVVVENTNKITDMIEDIRPIPDKLHPPEIEGADQEIRQMTYQGAQKLYGEELPEIVAKRIDKELSSIIDNGYAVLYLISQKLVKKSNEDGYLVGSRGSVGSSLVATLTGITEVNPLPAHYICPSCYHSEFFEKGEFGSGADLPEKDCPSCKSPLNKEGFDIPFEVFLGFEGDKVPDIDLNFSGDYQASAHKYVEEIFGSDHVFRAGTISTIAERTAFGYVKNYLEEKNIYYNSAELNRLIKGCSGVKRTTGQHPGGLIVVPKSKESSDFTPLQRPAEMVDSEIITTHFDFHSLHDYLIKLDILGHDDPTVIKMLEDLTGLDAMEISFDNPQVMELFSSRQTLGVPEFGTRFVRQMLQDTKPEKFSDLVRISGFSHGTDVWLNNAQDLIKNKVCSLSEAISARDDIMIYLINKGMDPLTSFKIMEDVRRGRGLKEEYEKEMREHEVPAWYIESCNKIKYMFPKAHAVAYVMMAFRIAYFKIHHPLAFYASYFTVRAPEFDAEIAIKGHDAVEGEIKRIRALGNQATQKENKLLTILEVVQEMYQRGFSFQKISLEKSSAREFLIEGEQLILPFSSLAGIGETAALNIEKEIKEKEFKSIEDFRNRTKVSKTVIDALIAHGTFGGLPENNQLSFFA